MTLGPLEYLVVSEPDDHFTDEIIPLLQAIHDTAAVRVVDLLFVSKDGAGAVTTREVGDLPEEEIRRYAGLAGERWGLLTAEDVRTLTAELPAKTSAVILLLEHAWTIALTAAITRAGGSVIAGGMVSPEAVTQLRAELSESAPR